MIETRARWHSPQCQARRASGQGGCWCNLLRPAETKRVGPAIESGPTQHASDGANLMEATASVGPSRPIAQGAVAYCTTTEAARLLGVTRSYLQHAASEDRAIARRLRMWKPGRDWLIPRAALEAELTRRKGGAA